MPPQKQDLAVPNMPYVSTGVEMSGVSSDSYEAILLMIRKVRFSCVINVQLTKFSAAAAWPQCTLLINLTGIFFATNTGLVRKASKHPDSVLFQIPFTAAGVWVSQQPKPSFMHYSERASLEIDKAC